MLLKAGADPSDETETHRRRSPRRLSGGAEVARLLLEVPTSPPTDLRAFPMARLGDAFDGRAAKPSSWRLE